jgi:N-acetylmuramic acid 6-phosphate etherase
MKEIFEEIAGVTTEQRNAASTDIDSKSALEVCQIINSEEKKVAPAIERTLPEIAALVDDVVAAFKAGGRLFYVGAGTSGRLGVLDAAECPPTYGVEKTMVQALIAGGERAFVEAVENAEDNAEAGVADLKARGFTSGDVLVGLSASGGAAYVLAALKYAADLGAVTGAVSCNANPAVFGIAKHKIYLDVGPEVVTGSTRMKSGSGEKMVLTMISTASMIRLGKVYKNLMVDVKPTNDKLRKRSVRLIREICGVGEEEAKRAFAASGNHPKVAIVMTLTHCGPEEAAALLEKADGHISGIV